MTDFLSNLLVRNTSVNQAGERLHPRQLSRFERAPLVGRTAEVEIDPEPDVPAAQPERMPPRSSSGEVGPGRRAEPVHDTPERPTTRPVVPQVGPSSQPLATPRPVPRPAVEQSDESLRLQTLRAERLELPIPAEETRPLPRPRRPLEDEALEAPVPPRARPGFREERGETRLFTHRERKDDDRLSPAPPAQPPVQPARRQTETPILRHAAEPGVEAQPVIHVSIGRVEVRAVQTNAAAAQSQTRRASSVVSLEEYLRRRGGER